MEQLSLLSQTQRERLVYIDFRLYFLGEVRRQDLMERFGIASAAATRDFALYRELFPENARFEATTKTYAPTKEFRPGFDHSPERVLTALSRGFGDGLSVGGSPMIRCEFPLAFNRPSMAVLAPVTRAISRGKAVSLRYFSHSSGASVREIVPFALVDDGRRWHVRAFDRKSQEFRDFVFTRMEDTCELEGTVQKHELSSEDIQWNRIVELEMVPHPERAHPEVIERDYGMENGVLRIRVRAANAGYMLRHWLVDCSRNHSLKDEAYRLWLRDALALYGVSSAWFAPGYESVSAGNRPVND